MTEIIIKILNEAVNKNGRIIIAQWNTDDIGVNTMNKTPAHYQKTFNLSLSNTQIRDVVINDISGIVSNSINAIESVSLKGQEFKVNI